MPNFLNKKIKLRVTILSIVVFAFFCVTPGKTQISDTGSRSPRKGGYVLIVPARPRVIQLAHELAGMRNMTLVAFREEPGAAELLMYAWGKDGWRHIKPEDFTALKFCAGVPDAALVVGDDQTLPGELLTRMTWPCKIERIKSVLIADLVNSLNEYFHFSPQEWKKLAQNYELTLSREKAPLAAAPTNILSETNKAGPTNIEPAQAAPVQPEKIGVPEKKEALRENKREPGRKIRLNLGENITMVFVRFESLPIWVGRDEVTNAQYKRFDRAHDPKKYYDHAINLPDQPVVLVSWEDAVNFCGWLNRKFSAQLPPGCEFRLPTEEEWMAFALCGRERKYPWGDKWPPPDSFNYKGIEGAGMFYNLFHNEKFIRGHDDQFIVAAPVDKSGTNEWGLYGVGGNVWEWCQDWYDETRTTRILKGAAWNNSAQALLTITNRSDALPEKSNAMIGFRVVIAPQKKMLN